MSAAGIVIIKHFSLAPPGERVRGKLHKTASCCYKTKFEFSPYRSRKGDVLNRWYGNGAYLCFKTLTCVLSLSGREKKLEDGVLIIKMFF